MNFPFSMYDRWFLSFKQHLQNVLQESPINWSGEIVSTLQDLNFPSLYIEISEERLWPSMFVCCLSFSLMTHYAGDAKEAMIAQVLRKFCLGPIRHDEFLTGMCEVMQNRKNIEKKQRQFFITFRVRVVYKRQESIQSNP